MIGYLLNWTVRHDPKPDAREVTALISAALGGTAVLHVQDRVACQSALAWYLIGLASGFFAYTTALWMNWDAIANRRGRDRRKRVPLFPWRD